MTRFACDPDILRRLPLFSSLTEGQLAWVLPAVKRRTYPARCCILSAGEIPDGLYVLLSGRVRLVHEDGEGRELIAAAVGCNDFFGEMGLIDAGPCPASVHSMESCEVLHVPRNVLLDYLADNATAAMSMLRTVLDRLCDAHRKMASLALTNVHGRVTRALLENGREANGEWLVDVGAEQIAAMVGASREMVSRVVKSMIERGVVRRYKRKLIVIDRDALARPAPHDRPTITALPPAVSSELSA